MLTSYRFIHTLPIEYPKWKTRNKNRYALLMGHDSDQ